MILYRFIIVMTNIFLDGLIDLAAAARLWKGQRVTLVICLQPSNPFGYDTHIASLLRHYSINLSRRDLPFPRLAIDQDRSRAGPASLPFFPRHTGGRHGG